MPARTLSQKVADDLREQVSTGRLKVGDAIPSQARLTEQYGVSTSVTRKAVDQLRHEGLLAGQPGKAVFVQATPAQRAEEIAQDQRLAARIERLESQVRSLAEGAGVQPDLTAVEELRADAADTRREIATLRAHLIDLYGRVGHAYPYNDVGDTEPEERKASGGSR